MTKWHKGVGTGNMVPPTSPWCRAYTPRLLS